jgi:hypothetical protein
MPALEQTAPAHDRACSRLGHSAIEKNCAAEPGLLRLVREQGEQFEALVLPFQRYFCGKGSLFATSTAQRSPTPPAMTAP